MNVLSDMAETHIALLRGINVGGKNKLPMKDLAAIFADAGATEVRTYIQSGNVVFTAGRRAIAGLANTVTNEIESRLGLKIPVVLRSRVEIEAARDANPYLDRASNPKALHVVFLRDRPTLSAVAALDPHRSPPDEFAVLGREVFLYCPNGVGRSKLTTMWIDRALGTVATIRNWNTMNALVEICRESAVHQRSARTR
jgi:uncharacterized protein (DUF1697 family)